MEPKSFRTAKIISYQITEDQYQMYKNYSDWTSFQAPKGFYSSIPAYQQLSLATNQIPSALYSPTTSSESDQTERVFFSVESTRDFKLNCEHCGSTYTSRKRLQNHYEKCNVLHAGSENVIICKTCKKTFKTNSGYTNHMTKFHGGIEQREVSEITESQEDVNKSKEGEERPRSIFHSIDILAKSDACEK